MLIHYCYWAGSPYVYLSCAPKTGYHAALQNAGEATPDIHECEDNDDGTLRYTFAPEQVTCPYCLLELPND